LANLIYRFCRGYVIGVCIMGTIFILSFIDWSLQLLFGASLANVGWNWLRKSKRDD